MVQAMRHITARSTNRESLVHLCKAQTWKSNTHDINTSSGVTTTQRFFYFETLVGPLSNSSK
jgi:hypothetical protein